MTAASCTEAVTVVVENPTSQKRLPEMVELDFATLASELALVEGETLVLKINGKEQPYQITHDAKFIFLTELEAGAKAECVISKGKPSEFETIAYGNVHPERMEDMAWENDKVGFRAYGPALQALGEKGFGYDLFVKRGTKLPVLDKMYAMETDKEVWAKINELKKTDPEAAEQMRLGITYHVDRGNGMDCYAVGPTLGAGVAALMGEEGILFPWCYEKYEILDNGPLRFQVRLQFKPVQIPGGETVTEIRTITLDAGSHMNRTLVRYEGLEQQRSIVSGIVMHGENNAYACEKNWIAFDDPTTGSDNGRIFLGHCYTQEPERTGLEYGHVLGYGSIAPGESFEYYWGFAWDRAVENGITSFDIWKGYMKTFSEQLKNPLKISINQ